MTIPRRALLAVFAALALAAPAAQAGDVRPVVVELFTSQGCSSCPPADALMAELAKRPDVIALSFNVDYWDYTGWKDNLARPEFGQRARAYVDRLKLQSPYTPQMIVDGLIDVAGNNRAKVTGVVEKQANGPRTAVPVTIAAANGKIGVTVGAGTGAAKILVLRTQSAVAVDIGQGENKGKKITYTNSVRRVMDAGDWTGAQMSFALPQVEPDAAKPSDGVVVILQQGPGGPILGAAQLKF
jgi:hypothetical protein